MIAKEGSSFAHPLENEFINMSSGGEDSDFWQIDDSTYALVEALSKSGWWIGDYACEACGNATLSMHSGGIYTNSHGIEDGRIWISLRDGTLMLRPEEPSLGDAVQTTGNQYMITPDMLVTKIMLADDVDLESKKHKNLRRHQYIQFEIERTSEQH